MVIPGFGAYPKTISNHPTLLTNLISYWEMEEVSGARADSITATGNDLTDNNTVTQSDGIIRKGAQFTAANNEYLSHADNASLSTGDIDFTLAAWVYLDSKPAEGSIMSKDDAGLGNQREYGLRYLAGATDRFNFLVSPNGIVNTQQNANSLGSPSLAQWYFVVAWHDATANTINIQIDNGAIDSNAHATGVFDSNTAFNIGADNGLAGTHFDGRIDEVGFWKKVLTSAEKIYLYNNGKGRNFK